MNNKHLEFTIEIELLLFYTCIIELKADITLV